VLYWDVEGSIVSSTATSSGLTEKDIHYILLLFLASVKISYSKVAT
jgi:hypothetical protein